MSAIRIQYCLHPPAGASTPALPPNASYSIPISVPLTGDRKTYYDGLRTAIAEAKMKAGEELTVWRDAVGKSEIVKEKKPTQSESDDEDEEMDDRNV